MKQPVLQDIFRYPIKGFAGEKLSQVEVQDQFGIVGDRKYGLAHQNQFPNTPDKTLPWHAKKFFLQQNDWPDAYFLDLTWNGPDHVCIEQQHCDLKTEQTIFSQKISNLLAHWKPHPSAYQPMNGQVTLVGMDQSRYPDRFKNHVSILNQASLDELNQQLPSPTAMNVFRGNLILKDCKPWEEFLWQDKILRIGSVEFKIDKPIVRCFNVEINPQDIRAPLPVLKSLAKIHRKAIFGVMANVSKGGSIREGDSVQIIDC